MAKVIENSNYQEAINVLNNDGIVALPTDTVFGLCTKINKKENFERLKEVKHRPDAKAFPIMVSSIEQLETITTINEIEKRIINKLMPGPLTIVLKKKDNVEDWVSNGKKTIAIRLAQPKYLIDIINETGPLFMTSANLSGTAVGNSPAKINEQLGFTIDLIINGTPEFKEPSTIVEVVGDQIEILRDGPISLDDIKEAIE